MKKAARAMAIAIIAIIGIIGVRPSNGSHLADGKVDVVPNGRIWQ